MSVRDLHPVATGGRSWRETLIEYNRKPEDNPFGLLPAWRLYRNGVYGELIETFGVESVFILSAGWGLIASEFLTPSYDIAFSGNAEHYKRRRRRDRYMDFLMPDVGTRPIMFLGGRDYVPLFCSLSANAPGERIVFCNSNLRHPPGCRLVPFETRTGTNWHYECARALIRNKIDF